MSLGLAVQGTGTTTILTTVVQVSQDGAVGLVIIGLLAIFAMFLGFPTYGNRDMTTYVRWLP
jgi:hypothetical protein